MACPVYEYSALYQFLNLSKRETYEEVYNFLSYYYGLLGAILIVMGLCLAINGKKPSQE
jgi:hypothetical protein